MPALAELERAWVDGARRPGLPARELDGLLATYVGRPSPLYHARAAVRARRARPST